MCWRPINTCSKSGCPKENELSTKQCDDAKKSGKDCKKPAKKNVPKKHRQLCKDHNNGKKPGSITTKDLFDDKADDKAEPGASGPGLANPNVPKATTFPIDKKTQELSIRENDSSNESSRSASREDAARAKKSAPKPSKDKQPVQDVPEGYLDNYRGYDYRPVKPLAPEPAEWEEWRKKPPADDLTDSDSRNGRWGRALMTHEDRAWPLPYEEFHAYVSRQGLVLGRSMDEFPNFNQEYYLWMIGDRQFHSADMNFLCKMMMEEINVTETYYNLQTPEPL